MEGSREHGWPSGLRRHLARPATAADARVARSRTSWSSPASRAPASRRRWTSSRTRGYFCVDNLPPGDDPRARRAVRPRGLEGRARRGRLRRRAAASTSTRLARCSTTSTRPGTPPPRAVPRRRRRRRCSPATRRPAAATRCAEAGSVAGGDRRRARAARAAQRARRRRDRHRPASRRAMLRRRIADEPSCGASDAGRLAVTFQSFGFKHGPARDADLVFDVPLPAQPALRGASCAR